MVARKVRFAVLLGLFILLPAGLAYGDFIGPIGAFVPGGVVMSPLLGIPATLLAAFLERPFVSLAGVKRRALAYSIRANLLSWLVGILFMIVCIPFFRVVDDPPLAIPLYALAAISLSICIEGAYLSFKVQDRDGRIRWRWIIAGNVLSAFALLLVGAITEIWGHANPLLARRVESYEVELTFALAALSLAILVYGLWPRAREPWNAPAAAGEDGYAEEAGAAEPGPLSPDAHEHAHASVGMAPEAHLR
jgi:hypothetical protein